jgi:uncharacterized membrane protein YGL010W
MSRVNMYQSKYHQKEDKILIHLDFQPQLLQNLTITLKRRMICYLGKNVTRTH